MKSSEVPTRALQRLDQVEDLGLDRGIESVVGSSRISSVGLRGQRHGDDDALLHPARELVGIALQTAAGSAIWTRLSASSARSSACFSLLAADRERLDDLPARP